MPKVPAQGRKRRSGGRARLQGKNHMTTTEAGSRIGPQEAHYRQLLGAEFGKSLDDRGIQKGKSVKLFAVVNDVVTEVGTAILSMAGNDGHSVQRRLHLHDLPQTPQQDLVVITGAKFTEDASELAYPYKFKGGEGPPAKLSDVYKAGLYAWDTRMMVAVRSSSEQHQDAMDVDEPVRVERRPEPSPKPQEAGKTTAPDLSDRDLSDRDDFVLTPPRKRVKGAKQRSLLSAAAPASTELSTQAKPTVSTKTKPPSEPSQHRDVATVDREDEHLPTVANSHDPSTDDNVTLVDVVPGNDLADRGRDVAIRSYETSAYVKVEALVMLSQVVQPLCTLRNVGAKHVKGLEERFKKYGYDYGSGLMTITVRRSENSGLQALLPNSIFEYRENVDGEGKKAMSKLLKSPIRAIVVDGLHRRQSLTNIMSSHGNDPALQWLHEPLRVLVSLRRDGKDMTNTEILRLGSHRNTVSSTVRPFETLEDHVYAVISYLKSFAEELHLQVDEVRPSNLADEMHNSELIPNMKKGTYRRYARIAKLFTKHPSGFEELKKLKPDDPPCIGASHLDHSAWFEVDEQGVLLFLNSVHAYVRNPATTGIFSAKTFFGCAMDLYEKCRDTFNTFGAPRQQSFFDFLDTKLKHTKGKTISIRELFIAQMRLFSDKSKAAQEKNLQRASRFVARIKSFYEPKQKTLADDAKETASSEADDDVKNPASPSSSGNAPLRRSTRERKAPEQLEAPAFHQQHRQAKRKAPKPQKNNKPAAPTPVEDDNLDEEGYMRPAENKASGPFDDVVPPLLPHGYQDPQVYKGEPDPWWQRATAACPLVAEKVFRMASSGKVELHHTPWLRAVHIPCGHRAHLYLDIHILMYFHRLAWLMASKKQIEFMRSENPSLRDFLPADSWEQACSSYENGEGAPYFATCGTQLKERGYCILEGFADDSDVPKDVLESLRRPNTLERSTVQDLFTHYVKTFPGEQLLKDPNKRNLWNPIINIGEDEGDRENRDEGKARYSSTRMLLMEKTEESPEDVWASVRRATLEAWLGQLSTLLGLTNSVEEKMWMPNTGGRFLLTGKGCPRQAAHNDFQVPHRREMHKAPGYFIMVNGSDPFPLWFCKYSHQFVFNPLEYLRCLAKGLKLSLIVVPSNSVFFGHGYATHAGAGHDSRVSDATTIRFHCYLIPEERRLPDSVFYSFGEPLLFAEPSVLELVEKETEAQGKKPGKQPIQPMRSPQGDEQDDGSADDDDDQLANRSEGSDDFL